MGKARGTRLRRVAVHEAGHAVAAVHFRHGLKRATVEPGEDSLGHILANRLPRSVRRALGLEWPTLTQRRRVDGFLTMLLAGPAAERRLAGRWNHVGARQDYADAADVAMRASRDEADMNRQLNAAVDRGVGSRASTGSRSRPWPTPWWSAGRSPGARCGRSSAGRARAVAAATGSHRVLEFM